MINGLKGHDLWLDGGTGSGFVLESALLDMHTAGRSVEDMPYTLGIDYKPEGSVQNYSSQLPKNLSTKHRIWNDRLFEEIPLQELNLLKAKLITDFVGAYSYSSDPAEVINRYLSIMDREGVLVIVYNINVDVVRIGERDFPFHEWLQMTAPELSVEYGKSWVTNAHIKSPRDRKVEVNYMLIRNPSGQSVVLPNLALSLRVQKTGDEWHSIQIFRPYSDIIAY